MVLNNEGIKNALKSGKLSITEYTWDNKVKAKSYNSSQLRGGHKIRLHVGFLVRTLSDNRWLNPRVLFNKRDGIIDLRKLSDRQYELQPKESVILFTNEVIKMGAEYFGVILSRVSLEETGIVVSQSYIDPNWEGVLQLIVTNNSETPKLLQEHCEIANLFIFKMEQPAKATQLNKNDHYAVTWVTISENPMYPKWQDRKRTWFVKVRHCIRTYWYVVTGMGILSLLPFLDNIASIISAIYQLFFTSN